MAEKGKVKKQRQKAMFAAMEGLRPIGGFPLPPRKAMSKAKKASKKLDYPVPPYAGVNLWKLYKWASFEWKQLGHRPALVTPVAILVALLTWEREKELQEARWEQLERIETKHYAATLYGAFGRRPRRKKLFGVIPMPGGR